MAIVEVIHSLAHYEDIISGGMDTFIEVGQALQAIKDAKLYKGTHESFKEYCEERWRISGSHAYRLINKANGKMRFREREAAKNRAIKAERSARREEAERVKEEELARIKAEEEAGQIGISEDPTGEPCLETIDEIEDDIEEEHVETVPKMSVEEFNEKYGVVIVDTSDVSVIDQDIEDILGEIQERTGLSAFIYPMSSRPNKVDQDDEDSVVSAPVPSSISEPEVYDVFEDERNAASDCDDAFEKYRVALIDATAAHEALYDYLLERYNNVPNFHSKGEQFMESAKVISASGLIDATEKMIERWIKAKTTVPELTKWS